MPLLDAQRLLLFSAGLAVFFSSLLGMAMLIPMQPWSPSGLKKIKFKQIGAAHLDWFMLAFMQGLAAALMNVFEPNIHASAVWALVVGGWMNPLPYVFRAFGINAFSFSGPPMQKLSASLGAASSLAILYGWGFLLWVCVNSF